MPGPPGKSPDEGAYIVQQPCDGRPAQRVRLWYYGDTEGIPYYALVTEFGTCWGESRWLGPVPVRGFFVVTTTCSCHWKRLAYSLRKDHPWAGNQIVMYEDGEVPTGLSMHVHNASKDDEARVVFEFRNSSGRGERNDTFEFIRV
ncbi:RICIN domain-containing protein [Streptomyces tsukubensis]|uniref:RICIN domain-containing protein n=1 Tax=Streptomyces tsukubensis TaxID=83656 RepID=UPI00344D5C0B